jgi:hypothetical membrane protein
MKEQLAKLLTVKSITTILFNLLVFILALKGSVTGEEVMRIYTIIITFYFGTQHEKNKVGVQDASDTKETDNNK